MARSNGILVKGRGWLLRGALGGLVVAAASINAGFWAAVYGAEGVAGGLRPVVLAAALFTGSTFALASVLHAIKVRLHLT